MTLAKSELYVPSDLRLPRTVFPSIQFRAYSTPTEADLHKQIEANVKKDKVVLYMKGVPAMPQCGFSRTVVQILEYYGTWQIPLFPLLTPDQKEEDFFLFFSN